MNNLNAMDLVNIDPTIFNNSEGDSPISAITTSVFKMDNKTKIGLNYISIALLNIVDPINYIHEYSENINKFTILVNLKYKNNLTKHVSFNLDKDKVKTIFN